VLKIVWKFNIGISMEVGFVIYVVVFGVGWREREFEHCVRWLCVMAMRCAERSGTCTMLWQHEFYMVNEPRHGAYLYQALELKVGSNASFPRRDGHQSRRGRSE
jgi:hypothetical protein